MKTTQNYYPTLEAIEQGALRAKHIVKLTEFEPSIRLSKQFDAHISLKREDLQRVRSYKIRGAYNKISSLSETERSQGIICASAGNHAQGVAFACKNLKIKGKIVMPLVTPKQKILQTELFGEEYIEVILAGDTFDDSYEHALQLSQTENTPLVHPFDDPKIIEGQASVGLEMIRQSVEPLDYVLVPIGGGGLAAGICAVFELLSPDTKIIGVEPAGAPSMKTSLEKGENTKLETIDKFVDGAAVQKIGDYTYEICKNKLNRVIAVPEGKVCQIILQLYNRDAIVVEPAGALTIAALDFIASEIKGKNVGCVVSGSNNDIVRTAEIQERALLYSELKHYFIIDFPQRPGALKQFVADVLGPNDDITFFEYSKKSSRANAPAVVGIELKQASDLEPLVTRMKEYQFFGEYLNNKPQLFQYLV